MTNALGVGPNRKAVLVPNTILHFDAAGKPTYGTYPLADRRVGEADASLILDIGDLYNPDDFLGNDVLERWAARRGIAVEGVDVVDLLWSLSIDFLCPYVDEDTWELIRTALDNEDLDAIPRFEVCLHGDLVEAAIEDLRPGG